MTFVRMIISTLAAMLLLATFGFAQWMPMTAKVRETTTASTPDKKVAGADTREGYFHRRSDGSTARIWLDVKKGTMKPVTGEIMDNQKLAFYSVRYDEMQATEHHKFSQRSQPPDSQKFKDYRMGEAAVEGIPCKNFPAYVVVNKQKKLGGVSCNEANYGEPLRQTLDYDFQGYHYHKVTELYEIKMGEEPDPKLFEIESRFTVFRATPPTGK